MRSSPLDRGRGIRHRCVEFSFGHIPAISDPFKGLNQKGSGDRHSGIVTDMLNVCNLALHSIICSSHPTAVDVPRSHVWKPRFEMAKLLPSVFISGLCRKTQPTTIALEVATIEAGHCHIVRGRRITSLQGTMT